MDTSLHQRLVTGLRQAVPYVNALVGRRVVVYLESEVIDDLDVLNRIIQDLALLDSIGVDLVLVHGSRADIDRILTERGKQPQVHNKLRITDEDALSAVKLSTSETRIRIEGLFSQGRVDSTFDGARLKLITGNAIVAKPVGVIDGVDFAHSGTIRAVKDDFIRSWLDSGSIVLLSSLAHSPTGEVFNVRSIDVATEVAIAIHAEKLLILSNHDVPRDDEGNQYSTIDSGKIDEYNDPYGYLKAAAHAVNGGVRRSQILDARIDGAIIIELFTRDGVGTLIEARSNITLRNAISADVPAIHALIDPLIANGVLVARSSAGIEARIDDYTVIESDNHLIACGALHVDDGGNSAEIACLVVDAAFEKNGHGDTLLRHLEARARQRGITMIYVLTTATSQWFQQRNYLAASLNDLPAQKRAQYDTSRQSRIYQKKL